MLSQESNSGEPLAGRLRQQVDELSAAEARLRSIVDHALDAILTVNQMGLVESFNPAAERIFGVSAQEAIGRNISTLISPVARRADDHGAVEHAWVADANIVGKFQEAIGLRRDGTTFPLELAISEFRWNDRTFFTGIARDISARKRSEQTLRFLADASAALSSLVDLEATLQKIGQLAAALFADWCILFLAEADGSLRQLPPAHVDPSKAASIQEWLQRYPLGRDEARGALYVLRTGRSELVEEIPESLLSGLAADEAHLEKLRELAPKSYMCVPIKTRGAPLGVVLFVAAESGRRYDAADLAAAEDLARRAGIAIENARLFEELRDADRRKADFLAMLAHELRNPLAPIKTCIELMRPGVASGSELEMARDIIDRQVEQLTRLVDDLLDISRISKGKFELSPTIVDLAAMLHEAVETSRPLIAERRQDLTVSLPDEPMRLRGDRARLRQIFVNLLNNAAKYSKPGGQIWLSARQVNDVAEVRVRDVGIGIPPEQLPHLFDMFVQSPQGAAQAMGGLGIGLSLVRSLTELHGGTVAVSSEGPGKGSEFVVRLPLSLAALQTEASIAPSAEGCPQPASVRRILVIDENTDAAQSLGALLKSQGHEVSIAFDCDQALEAVETAPPDVVFLELALSAMSGYELARQIRQRLEQTGRRAVLVALTGLGREEDRLRSQAAGIDCHVVKPVTLRVLQELLA